VVDNGTSQGTIKRPMERSTKGPPSAKYSNSAPNQASRAKSTEMFRRWSEHTSDDDFWSEGGGKYAHVVPDLIATVFPSITNAPIRLQAKRLEDVFETKNEIIASLKSFYVAAMLSQIYRIIASLELLGNPRIAVNSLITGLRDFFFEPSRALISKNPTNLVLGFGRGTLSLVSHSTSGMFGFASKMSSTLGTAAVTLSFDKEYKNRRAHQLAKKETYGGPGGSNAKKIAHAIVVRPMQDVVNGVVNGVTGIVVEPIRGAKKGGTTGLAKGVAIGTLGAFARPIVGVFDACAHVTETIHDVAKSVNILERRLGPVQKRKLPCQFGIGNRLLPFSQKAAFSLRLLSAYPLGKKIKGSAKEFLVIAEKVQMEPGCEVFVVVTTLRVATFNFKKEGTSSLVWQVIFDKETPVQPVVESKGHSRVVLHIIQSSNKPQPSHFRNNSDELFFKSKGFLADASDEQTMSRLTSVSSVGMPLPNMGELNGNLIPFSGSNSLLERKASLHGLPSDASSMPREQEIQDFALKGDFEHKQQFIRIHNAICCLTSNFASIITESDFVQDNDEGTYTFGYMTFSPTSSCSEESDNISSMIRGRLKKIMFYDLLEHALWKEKSKSLVGKFSSCPFSYEGSDKASHLNPQVILESKQWKTFSDQLQVSKAEGGPTWLIQARAKSMFVAPIVPLLPLSLSKFDPIVNDVIDQLKSGSYTLLDFHEIVHQHMQTLEAINVEVALSNSGSDRQSFNSEAKFSTKEKCTVIDPFVLEPGDRQNFLVQSPSIQENSLLSSFASNDKTIQSRLDSVELMVRQLLLSQKAMALPSTSDGNSSVYMEELGPIMNPTIIRMLENGPSKDATDGESVESRLLKDVEKLRSDLIERVRQKDHFSQMTTSVQSQSVSHKQSQNISEQHQLKPSEEIDSKRKPKWPFSLGKRAFNSNSTFRTENDLHGRNVGASPCVDFSDVGGGTFESVYITKSNSRRYTKSFDIMDEVSKDSEGFSLPTGIFADDAQVSRRRGTFKRFSKGKKKFTVVKSVGRKRTNK